MSCNFALGTATESKRYIGERPDADAGLQYLNARYWERRPVMFIQPDWGAVKTAGVGINRHSQSFDTRVDMSDGTGDYATAAPHVYPSPAKRHFGTAFPLAPGLSPD